MLLSKRQFVKQHAAHSRDRLTATWMQRMKDAVERWPAFDAKQKLCAAAKQRVRHAHGRPHAAWRASAPRRISWPSRRRTS